MALVSRGIWLLALVLTGCTPLASGGATPGATGPEAAAQRKTITVGAVVPFKGFESWNTQPGGTTDSIELSSNGLLSTDVEGKPEGRLAASLPSLQNGTLIVLPDGRMQATWPLRPNIKWQDGLPFTADDVVFGWEVATDPAIPGPSNSGAASILRQIEKVEAPNPLTVLITWKSSFYRAQELPVRTLWPLPRHLLRTAFDGDKGAFLNLPYWTTDYVHLGPFRLTDFGLGENLVFERFDGYFLGRPKVDRIIFRIIQDPNTLAVNLQAGAVDIAASKTLSYETMKELRDGWARTGEGTVVESGGGGGFRALIPQMHSDRAQPLEVSQDVRVRRGLYFGIDRSALSEALLAGAAGSNTADSFMDQTDPRASIVGQPFARYPYDPARGLNELAAAGWQPGSDGRLVGRAGQQVQLTVRTTSGGNNARELAVVAQFWRQLGIEITEEVLTSGLVSDLEVRAKFTAFEITAVGGGERGEQTLERWDSRIAPTLEGRYVGNNRGSYINSALDRIIDQLKATLDEREQARLLKEGGEILATDLPTLPLYSPGAQAAVRRGIVALREDFRGGNLARNAHLWDRE